MLFKWLRQRRRTKLLSKPASTEWNSLATKLPYFERLEVDEQERLIDISRIFLSEKKWEGCGGLKLTEDMKMLIALQACLLILNIEHEYYKWVLSIYVYPSAYKNPNQRLNADGSISQGSANLGEAWQKGPVVLAWDAALLGGTNDQDGRNLVFHEFAHKLDFLSNYADGTPPLKNRESYARWQSVMKDGYETLVQASKDRTATLLDKYGATNSAEFFAVATECFFEKSIQLNKRHPELYGLLADYYQQDPAERKRKSKA